MWPNKSLPIREQQPPTPLDRNPERPTWPSALECTNDLSPQQEQNFPRGGKDLSRQQYHLFIYRSLHGECKQVFKIWIGTFRRAEDHTISLFYVERYVFCTERKFLVLMDWLEKIQKKKFSNTKTLWNHLQISKYYCIEARVQQTWNEQTWFNIKGLVACKYYWSSFWCSDELDEIRPIYLAMHPKSIYHDVNNNDEKQAIITQAIMDLRSGVSNCMQTPAKFVSPQEYNSINWLNKRRGYVKWCPPIISLFFDLPLTGMIGNFPKYVKTGNIKSGTLSQLLPTLPEPCIHQKELQECIDEYKDNDAINKVLVDLQQMIDTVVCTMFVVVLVVFCVFILSLSLGC